MIIDTSAPVRKPNGSRTPSLPHQSEKQRGAGNLYEFKPSAGKHTIDILDTRIADRENSEYTMALITTGPRITAASSSRNDQRHRLSPR